MPGTTRRIELVELHLRAALRRKEAAIDFENCFEIPAALTRYYPDTSCFDDVIVQSLELIESFPNLDLTGVIPRAPEVHNRASGADADRCRLLLNFMSVERHQLSRSPGISRGRLTLSEGERERKRFQFESPGLSFEGVCRNVILSLSPDSEQWAEQRRRTLRANDRLWNACLNRLAGAGWTTTLEGRPDGDGGAAEGTWIASRAELQLAAGSPLGLMGMWSLLERSPAGPTAKVWWEAPGDDPTLMRTISEDWERRNASRRGPA